MQIKFAREKLHELINCEKFGFGTKFKFELNLLIG